MMRVDAVVSAPLGLILAVSRPPAPRAARCGGHPRGSEAEVESTLDLEPETRAVPTLAGRCARCGGQVVGRISFPGDPDERRCIQCGQVKRLQERGAADLRDSPLGSGFSRRGD